VAQVSAGKNQHNTSDSDMRRRTPTLRTLAITQNITIDGSIEMLGDWFDPQGQAGVDDSDLLEELHRQDSRADALLVGRQTFEDFRGYWPKQADDVTGVSDYLLCHTLIGAGLVDEYRLFVYPVVQGRGRRLFPDGFELPKLKLLEAKAFRSGITYSRYARS
jgi:dihydrofolate reductase